jgi:hypothetical protein
MSDLLYPEGVTATNGMTVFFQECKIVWKYRNDRFLAARETLLRFSVGSRVLAGLIRRRITFHRVSGAVKSNFLQAPVINTNK